MSELVERIRDFADRHRLFDSPGVVAVSGGPDSVALLRALVEVGCGAITVAHVNHGLRGAESDADEAFVIDLAKQCGSTWENLRVDTSTLAASWQENLEAAARRIRYEWFEEVAGRRRAAWIATGHNADDQAETVLHRLIRGTGVQGLRGIAATRKTDTARIVRPMLETTRAEVIEYLAAIGQAYRVDSSNADPRFTRNRIRHEVLPLLKSLNPQVSATLGKLAQQAGEVFAMIEASITLLASAEKPRAGAMLIFDADRLTNVTEFLVCEVFRAVWRREGWNEGRMTAEHWQRLAAIARGEVSAADFPDGVTARRAGRVVQVERRT